MPNAQWAQAIVRGSRGLLRQHIPEDYLPVEPSQLRLPFPGVVQITEEFDEYGEGHYGVVFPTHHPCMAFKLTTDVHEAFFALVQNPKHRDIEGVVKYHCCLYLGQGRHTDSRTGRQSTRPVFAVVRDDVQDVGLLAREDEQAWARGIRRPWPEWMDAFQGHAHDALEELAAARMDYADDLSRLYSRIQTWIRNFEQDAGLRSGDSSAISAAVAAIAFGESFEWAGREVEPRVWHSIASAYVSASLLAEEHALYGQSGPFDRVAEALHGFAQIGVLLADVHGNNVGIEKNGCSADRSDSAPNMLIISDPGHAVCVDGGFEDEWKLANNPGRRPVLVPWWE